MRFTLNVDHVATLRNARGETQPDPITAALIAEQAGVDGIVFHLREDRRHINERDVRLLRELVTTKLDFEMAAVPEIIKIACDVGPELATLVPEKRQELTTEGGLNVIDNATLIKSTIEASVVLLPDPVRPAIRINPLRFSVKVSTAFGNPNSVGRFIRRGIRRNAPSTTPRWI